MTTKYEEDLQKAIQLSLFNYQQEPEELYTDDELQLKKAIEESLNEYSFDKIISADSVSANDHLMKKVLKKLNSFQKNIFTECIREGSGGLSLPLGSGKTLLSLVLSLYFTRETFKPVLVVVSKSLVGSWEVEIKKFFGDLLKYEIVHQNRIKDGLGMWRMKSDTNLILTTVDVLAKCYKDHFVSDRFTYQKYDPKAMGYITYYKKPDKPFLNHVLGGGIFFSREWGCLIVDEVQKYTNIETKWCQSLGSINSEHRWLLSGTMFDEPKVKRILGYHIILNAPGKPRNVPDTQKLVTSDEFKGLNETLIHRAENKAFKPPEVNEVIIKHKLNDEEEKIYVTMKKILSEVQRRARLAKLYHNEEELKKFNSYKLVMIMYLRQSLICPLIPLASIALNASNMSKKSELSKIIMSEMDKLGLKDWLDNEESIKSSRLDQVLKCVNKHDEKVIIFSCFKSFLDIGEYLIKKEIKDKPLFRMRASMSAKKRAQLIKNFEKSKNGILLLTYQLGAEGLNLQFASTILLVDFWWNASKEQQAIGRIFRYGQVSDKINVYFFTANTGIEKILFKKQQAKLQVLKELRTGKMETKIPFIKLDDVIKLIELSDNEELLKKVKFY
jgi:SNF2 family DNA or RNA helicase